MRECERAPAPIGKPLHGENGTDFLEDRGSSLTKEVTKAQSGEISNISLGGGHFVVAFVLLTQQFWVHISNTILKEFRVNYQENGYLDSWRAI